MHFKITFHNSNTGLNLTPNQQVKADAFVDTMQFGYPIVTFLVLALALPVPTLKRRLIGIAVGWSILIAIYSSWIVVQLYQDLSTIKEIRYLHDNWLVTIIPPPFYAHYKAAFILFLGQVFPILVYAAVLFRPHYLRRPS